MTISFIYILSVVAITFFLFLFFQRDHYLVILLILELIIMVFILGFPMVGAFMGRTSTPLILCLLVMGVCEARVGLSVMVYLVRFHGRDLLKSLVVGGL
jgi:NADH:ubiquinone oxidoreductase subunit K